MTTLRTRIMNCLTGFAIGDAYGYSYADCLSHEKKISSQTQLLVTTCHSLIEYHNTLPSWKELVERDKLLDKLKFGLDCWASFNKLDYYCGTSIPGLFAEEYMKDNRLCGTTTVRCYDTGKLMSNQKSIDSESLSRVIPVALYFSKESTATYHEISSVCAEVSGMTHGHELCKIASYFLSGLIVRLMNNHFDTLSNTVRNSLFATKTAFPNSKEMEKFLTSINTSIDLAKNQDANVKECIQKFEDGSVTGVVATAVYVNLKFPNQFNEVLQESLKYSKKKAEVCSIACSVSGLLNEIQMTLKKSVDVYERIRRGFTHIFVKVQEDILFSENDRYLNMTMKMVWLKEKWKDNENNLLFLDFDGVFMVEGNDEADYLKRIEKLCENYNLKVVISSLWKRDFNECLSILSPYNLNIIGHTTLEKLGRESEILEYLCTHPFKKFVILDDIKMCDLKDFAVHVDYRKGFTEEALNEAREVLNRQVD